MLSEATEAVAEERKHGRVEEDKLNKRWKKYFGHNRCRKVEGTLRKIMGTEM